MAARASRAVATRATRMARQPHGSTPGPRLYPQVPESKPGGRQDRFRCLALWQGQPASGLANLALAQTNGAALIAYGKTSAGEPGRSPRDLDLNLAAENLKLAIARGFTDVPALRFRPESPILLERKDVKPLIDDLESRKPSASPQPPK